MIISGNESAVTAIMNASAVPRGTPFSMRPVTSGNTPAAFEYKWHADDDRYKYAERVIFTGVPVPRKSVGT